MKSLFTIIILLITMMMNINSINAQTYEYNVSKTCERDVDSMYTECEDFTACYSKVTIKKKYISLTINNVIFEYSIIETIKDDPEMIIYILDGQNEGRMSPDGNWFALITADEEDEEEEDGILESVLFLFTNQ